MCKDPLHGFLAALPKCEHHVHLEGTLTPELVFELAAKNGVELDAATDPAYSSPEALYERYERFTSLDDFLHYLYKALQVLQHASDYEALAYAYFSRAASQGVRHAEVFFDPQGHVGRGISFETVVEGFQAARKRATAELGITTLLVPCFWRHEPLANALTQFRHAEAAGWYRDGTFAGMGMDSSEAPFPPPMWKELYDMGSAAGLRRTIHAGEEGPAEFVTQALDVLGVERIDHGVRSVEDEALLARLARDKIMLTTCPISNVQLKVIKTMSDFPLRKFMDAGVRISINSDDPAYFGGYIQENFCAVQEAFGLTLKEWEGIAKGAVLGSWCDEKRQAELLMEIDDVVLQFSMEAGEQ